MARIDLRKDSQKIRRYLQQRIRNHAKKPSPGPGNSGGRISQITFGFYFEQSGWVALVFDARKGGKSDGEWNQYIEPNAISMDHWFTAFDSMIEDKSPLQIALANGKNRKFDSSANMEEVAACFGEMLKETALKAEKDKLFEKLPLAKGWTITVEEMEGYYGWRSSPTVDPFTQFRKELEEKSAALPAAEKPAFWLKQLDKLAGSKIPADAKNISFSADTSWTSELCLREIAKAGKSMVVPLLKLARKRSREYEFTAVRGWELPAHTVVTDIFQTVEQIGFTSPEVERLLQQIVIQSCQVNKDKKLWGIIPWKAADCLHALFNDYPEPETSSRNNKLINQDAFVGRRKG